jgi:hypothetical protein
LDKAEVFIQMRNSKQGFESSARLDKTRNR